MTIAFLLLQAPATGGRGILPTLIPLVSFLLIFYFIIFLPQQRERRRHTELLSSLNKGDRVATVGGLVGDIVTVDGELVTLKSGDARVVVERTRISRRIPTTPAKGA